MPKNPNIKKLENPLQNPRSFSCRKNYQGFAPAISSLCSNSFFTFLRYLDSCSWITLLRKTSFFLSKKKSLQRKRKEKGIAKRKNLVKEVRSSAKSKRRLHLLPSEAVQRLLFLKSIFRFLCLIFGFPVAVSVISFFFFDWSVVLQ